LKTAFRADNSVIFGYISQYYFSDKEKSVITSKLGIECPNVGKSFKSIILHSKLYNIYSATTTRRCNSLISVDNTSYYLIRNIVLLNENSIFILASKLVCGNEIDKLNSFVVNKVCKKTKVLHVNRIDSAKYVIYNDPEGKNFVKIPNIFEIE
jgi:hypothetical protein